MEIYVLTRGCYSDYEVVGAFVDKQKALELAKIYDYDILTFYSDITINLPENKYFYRIHMEKDGSVPYTHRIDYDIIVDNTTTYWRECRYSPYNIFCCTVIAEDKNHAIKIVNERRSFIIAENKWGNEEFIKKWDMNIDKYVNMG